MLNISIAGRLGRDPETRHTQSGHSVTSLSVAISIYHRGEKGTQWAEVSIWGKRGESLAGILSKGSAVALSGAGRIEEYPKRDGTTGIKLCIDASDVTLLDSRQGQERPPQQQQRQSKPSPKPAPAADADFDDDIPF